MASKKCFVISPIGDDDTEIRAEADALLWVVRSALEKFDFEVIRVDQIARSTTITSEIIQLIQESELCLIVLTGHNPNVFYEAGRRHETGRPFIQLIRRGEALPFDVASIRTIIYDDIQSVSSAAKVARNIELFIEEFEKGGYGASGTGVSMSTIASALDRIERKIGQAMVNSTSLAGVSPHVDTKGGPGILRNPREAFVAAVAKGDLARAASILPRLEQLYGPTAELVAAAGVLSVQGYEPAAEMILRIISEHLHALGSEDFRVVKGAISALVEFYVITDREREGVERCEELIRNASELPDIGDVDKAYLLNQFQKLLFGDGRYEEALQISDTVRQLVPEEPAYEYNASLTYEALGLLHKQVESVDKYMSFSSPDPAHLSHAVETYIEVNRIDDARAAFAQLRQDSPDRAAILLFNSDIGDKLGV